jgi:hypothetical protein
MTSVVNAFADNVRGNPEFPISAGLGFTGAVFTILSTVSAR